MNNNDSDFAFSAEEAYAYLEKHPDTVLLDIRTAREHRERRIPGSLNLDRFEMNPRTILNLLPNRQRAVLVYCRAGIHSRAAVSQLRRMGYRAIELEGGLNRWDYAIEGTLA